MRFDAKRRALCTVVAVAVPLLLAGGCKEQKTKEFEPPGNSSAGVTTTTGSAGGSSGGGGGQESGSGGSPPAGSLGAACAAFCALDDDLPCTVANCEALCEQGVPEGCDDAYAALYVCYAGEPDYISCQGSSALYLPPGNVCPDEAAAVRDCG